MGTYCLIVQYDGTDYAGFQIQPDQRTIQGELERALSSLARGSIRVIGAGRTDAGVHSEGQTISFLSDSITVPVKKLPHALNRLLPQDIRVLKSVPVAEGFHANRDALEKTYRYRIYESEFSNVFWRRYAYWSRSSLDWERLKQAGQLFVGSHDFSAFAAKGSSVKTTVRTISKVEVCTAGDLKSVCFTADGFLYKMVRNLMGTLLDVGLGKLSPADVKRILKSGDRSLAAATISPVGLVLERVKYS